ncbi:MAG: hypothetical protein IT267_05160 [Saprospiraceae bacterium]|nr:hypothetical protein [Saprospiraceae bacterium]
MNSLRLFIFLVIFSCQKLEVFIVEDEFQFYLETFVTEGLKRNVNILQASQQINILFGTLSNSIVGQCQKSNDNHTILIERVYWDKASYLEREQLLFHELGHCILNRHHFDESHSGYCVSIMRSNSWICDLVYNSTTREGYLDELFKN